MTHEEAVTFHIARDVRSYRELPKILYHLQTKERDEPRPRAGVLRTREFTMKDSYCSTATRRAWTAATSSTRGLRRASSTAAACAGMRSSPTSG